MKKHIAVLCGGQSAEHEVSIESAKNVIQALDRKRYTVSAIFITRAGEWFLLDSIDTILRNETMQPLSTPFSAKRLSFQFGETHPLKIDPTSSSLPSLRGKGDVPIDVIFPVLHGTRGEDGTLQGLLEIANIPYVGAGVLGSAVCMDKDVSKRLLQQAGIPIAKWITTYREEIANLQFEDVIKTLGLPLFIKPANTGSSIGVSKVKNREDFFKALELAQQFDHKILLEEYIPGREIECSVLGNHIIEASLPGEIIPHAEFYSYEAKYLDAEGATLSTPANLPQDIINKVQTMAKQVFRILCVDGMARIDFFLTPDGRLFLNEANTIPGFTQISQYPNMWRVTGLAYADLLDRLITLALARFERNNISLHKNT